MADEQITLVQGSYKQVAPIATTAGELFYGKLFELNPNLRPLFKGDIKEQGDKLMKMIGIAVAGLDDLDSLLPAVKALGERHLYYGVKPSHYETVGEALLWTLEKGLGDLFTPETREAWAQTYEVLAKEMITAAQKKRLCVT